MRRIGHRGAMGHAPENTIASFQRAIELECDEVETDVWISPDGRLLVSHDRPGRHTVPTLDEVLDFCRGRVAVNVELKCEAAGPGARQAGVFVARYLARRGDPDVYLSSFWLSALEGAREAVPTAPLAYVIALPPERDSLLEAARELSLRAIHPNWQLATPDLLGRAHGAGLAVNVWTVNHPEQIARLVALGADGVISDFPERVPRMTAVAN